MINIRPQKRMLDKLFNLVLDAQYKRFMQILFDPTDQQRKDFWCDNCDGFHKTKNCLCQR